MFAKAKPPLTNMWSEGIRDFDLPQVLRTLRRLSRILWVRVALILALSVLAALSAKLLDPIIPRGPKDRFNEAATLPILNVLANGMLAVATFSLGVMVSSHRTMAEQTTPRIHRLLMEDTSTPVSYTHLTLPTICSV